MAGRRKKRTVSGVIAALLGFLCAVVLGALFYGTMVYQMAGQPAGEAAQTQDGVLALHAGTLAGQTQESVEMGGRLCSVTTLAYELDDGAQALAITAEPAAYLERLTAAGCRMQLITGFVIDDLDAVYAIEGETGILAAREGERVYLIEAAVSQQTLYELGASARRE